PARGPAGHRPRRRLLLQRPRGPGCRRSPGRAAARGTGCRPALLRHLPGQPAAGPGPGLLHLQAQVRPPRHQPARAGARDRAGRGLPRRAERRCARGEPLPVPPRLLRPVPPRGRLRPPCRFLSLRPSGGHGAQPPRPGHRQGVLMPRRTDLTSVLVIGSGPIVIGQAAEFDYSGTQACRVLREEGLRVILVNSNPATIMTDPDIADATYIEPIDPDIIRSIIAAERPDAFLPTLGGQTALNAAVALSERGTLEEFGVEMIGASLESIQKAEDRQLFKEVVDQVGGESARSRICHSTADLLSAAEELGYPIVVRPSFTMGGLGSGMAYDEAELLRIGGDGLHYSPTTEVLLE